MNQPALFKQISTICQQIFALNPLSDKRYQSLQYSDFKDKDILSLKEAAFYIGIDSAIIIEEAALGKLPGGQIGQQWFFSLRGISSAFCVL